MAAVVGLRVAAWRLGVGVPARRAFWGGLRKEEKEVEVDKVIPQEKSEPSLICPPPRSRSYLPPEDIQCCIESHVKEVFGPSLPDKWQQTPLKENRLKYRLLAQLAAELGHAVPNSQLHLMRSAEDVLNFYSTPVKDASKFDELCAAELPPNLKITWQQYSIKTGAGVFLSPRVTFQSLRTAKRHNPHTGRSENRSMGVPTFLSDGS